MKLGLNQSARLEQRLMQSPQMIQAMQILQLPALDLEERIEQELMENPFLELEPQKPDEDAAVKDEVQTDENLERDNMLDVLERYERDFGDGARPRISDGEDGDRKLEAMANTPAQPKSLAEALIEELAILDLDDHERSLAEFLIYSLDERGYLPELREDLVQQFNGDDEHGQTSVEEIEAMLTRLREISHPALGAYDLRECLLLQIDSMPVESPLLRALVTEHLDDIQSNRLPRISKATGRPIEAIKEAVETLRHLDPTPGAQYGEVLATVIIPDVVVEEIDGDYEVRLERQRTPELTISGVYREILKQVPKEEKVREWIQKRIESARWFIDAIQQRQSTLQRISDVIFRRQRDFLDKGISALHPLRMQEVADEVGVHISTVSRAVSGKYAQTPRGIFPLKFFFTGGTRKSTGEVASQVSIKQRIAELIDQEDGQNPLSDEELAKRLAETDNIQIARRTVTKYRKALSIPTSSQRRKF